MPVYYATLQCSLIRWRNMRKTESKDRASVELFDDPNRFADKPAIELSDVARFKGYQSFVLSRSHIEVDADDAKLRVKRGLTSKFLDPEWLKGRSILDIGANSAFFCFL